MIERVKKAGWITRRRITVGASLLLALTNVVFLGLSIHNQNLGGSLAEQSESIESNLKELQQADSQSLEAMKAELAAAQQELDRLKVSFPEIGAGFDLYRRGFELADQNGARIESIERMGTTRQATIAGDLLLTSYRLRARAGLGGCLSFISALEGEGLSTLALTSFEISPESADCNLHLDIASTGIAESPGSTGQ